MGYYKVSKELLMAEKEANSIGMKLVAAKNSLKQAQKEAQAKGEKVNPSIIHLNGMVEDLDDDLKKATDRVRAEKKKLGR